MLIFIGGVGTLACLVGVIADKKRRKTWGLTMAGFLVVLAVGSLFLPHEPTAQKEEVVLTEAEKFAKENGISVALAEDIEQALAQSEHSYDLSQVYKWTQIEDYAYGQRYTGWMDMEYMWVFYVNGDKLESIRQQKGLTFIYQAD